MEINPKIMKPTNNRVYCIGCKHPKMLFESQTKADNFIKFNRDAILRHRRKFQQEAIIVLSAVVGTLQV